MTSIKFFNKIKYFILNLITFFFAADNKPVHRCLIYHSVFKKKIFVNDIHSVKYLSFLKQINYLKKFKIIPIDKISKYNNEKTFSISFDDGYKDTFKLAYPILKKSNIPFAIFVTNSFLENKSSLYMNKKDLLNLSKNQNVIIGSHGNNHISFNKLSEKKLFSDLTKSKKKLELIIKRKINCISFPNGVFDKKIIKICKKVGFKFLFTSVPLANNKNNIKKKIINRQAIIYFDDKIGFKNKIYGKYDLINTFKKYILIYFNSKNYSFYE